MKLKIIYWAAVVAAFPCLASEQELLITTDFVLKAGASESRILTINKPAHMEQLVMIGFNPVKALSVDCVLRLYTASDVLLATYNCAERQIYDLKQLQLVAGLLKAQIDVSNNNFSAATTSFSVINRFKFIAPAR